jgi:hypothetical protein
MRAGQPCTRIIPFEAGLPDGDVTWALYDGVTLVNSGTITPGPGAISVNVQISGADNALPTGVLLGGRRLEWSYFSSAIAKTGEQGYDLEAPLPLGISPDGARRKLGLDSLHDLPDDQLPLVRAFLTFDNAAGAGVVAAVTDPYQQLLIRDAVEAMAALEVLPTLQVRIAQSETSGTNAYARADIDWSAIGEQLNSYVSAGLAVVVPDTGTTAIGGQLFLLSTPSVTLFPN